MNNKVECRNQIGFRIKCLSNLLKRKMLKDYAGIGGVEELGAGQTWIISFVAQRGEVFQREIEKHFNMRRSSVTKTLQNMEKGGLIVRTSVEGDARLKKIVLTEKALRFDREIRQSVQATEQELRKGLSAEQIRTFFEVADIIAQNLTEEDGEEEKC